MSQKNCYSSTKEYRRKYSDKLFFSNNRTKALERDNYTCVKCGMTDKEHREKYNRSITVDHIDGKGIKAKIKNNKLSNLQTLCLPCHSTKDGKRRAAKEGVKLFMSKQKSIKPCNTCGHIPRAKKKEKKKELSKTICDLMGWDEAVAWNLQNRVLTVGLMEKIVNKLSGK